MLSLFLTAVFIACGAGQSLSYDDFPYSQILLKEPSYVLSWNYNKSHIIFRTQVETEGYTGFGLSNTGKMPNSDVVIGGVYEDGTTYFSDRYAFEHAEPKKDKSKDWELISGEEEYGTTTLVFIRKLNTCDIYDYPIKKGPMIVIFSFSDTDPYRNGGLFHHDGRGRKHLVFINSTATIDETPCPF